jgi:hypothetical protein
VRLSQGGDSMPQGYLNFKIEQTDTLTSASSFIDSFDKVVRLPVTAEHFCQFKRTAFCLKKLKRIKLGTVSKFEHT